MIIIDMIKVFLCHCVRIAEILIRQFLLLIKPDAIGLIGALETNHLKQFMKSCREEHPECFTCFSCYKFNTFQKIHAPTFLIDQKSYFMENRSFYLQCKINYLRFNKPETYRQFFSSSHAIIQKMLHSVIIL